MAYTAMDHIVMVCIVKGTARAMLSGLYSYALYSYGIYSHGLYGYGLTVMAYTVMACIVMAYMVMGTESAMLSGVRPCDEAFCLL